MVAEGDGLGGLQVGEAGHRVGRMLGGAVRQGGHQRRRLRVQPVDGVAHPEAEIGRDLVVAAARGVQALAGLADALGQPRLDVHVDVLERGVEDEGSGLDLGADRRQAIADRRLVGRGEDAGAGQHGGVGERAAYVLAPQLAVEADGCVDLGHDGRRAIGEASAPLRVGWYVTKFWPKPRLAAC